MSRSPSGVVVFYTPGPGWDAQRPGWEQQDVRAHDRYLRQMVTSGAARCAGRFWRPGQVVAGCVGLVVPDLADVEDARVMIGEDPGVRQGQVVPHMVPLFPVG